MVQSASVPASPMRSWRSEVFQHVDLFAQQQQLQQHHNYQSSEEEPASESTTTTSSRRSVVLIRFQSTESGARQVASNRTIYRRKRKTKSVTAKDGTCPAVREASIHIQLRVSLIPFPGLVQCDEARVVRRKLDDLVGCWLSVFNWAFKWVHSFLHTSFVVFTLHPPPSFAAPLFFAGCLLPFKKSHSFNEACRCLLTLSRGR